LEDAAFGVVVEVMCFQAVDLGKFSLAWEEGVTSGASPLTSSRLYVFEADDESGCKK